MSARALDGLVALRQRELQLEAAALEGYPHQFSGGQRQRIAIARALLKKAPLLILDEATSALDTWTEARIQRALDALKKGRTTFVIAHRLSTVSHADQIIVLDQGRIIEQGTFDQLVAIQGAFAEMLSEGGFSRPDADRT